jgi:signal transduction histidine kinase
MTRRWSFRTRFVAAAALCLLPLIGVVLFLLDQSLDHSRDQLVSTEFTIADVVAQGLAATLNENQLALVDVAEDPYVRDMNATQAQNPLDQVRRARPYLNGLFLLDTTQRVVTVTGGIDPGPLLTQFQDVVDTALIGGEPAISDRLLVPEGNVAVIALVVPVLPDPGQTIEGTPVGAVGAFLTIDRLQQAFLSGSTSDGETTIAVVAETGQVIVDRGDSEKTSETLTMPLMNGLVKRAITGQRGNEIYEDGAGAERIAVVAPVGVPALPWAVVITSPSPTTYGPNDNLLERGLIALAAAVILTLTLAVILGELTARPLRELTSQASAITQGDLSRPIEQVGRGEVAALSNALRDMADRLTTQVRDTEAAREEVAHQAERLRELLRRTVRLQEDERRRIASDIHDAVSPLITGALYQTRALKLAGMNGGNGNGHTNGEDNTPAQELATVGDLLERAMNELHDVIFALRPPDLDDLGVVAAIDRYVQQIDRTGLPCHLEVIGTPERLSPEARLGVYRIVQEALHNALRHAHADEANVRMEWLDDRLRVTIHDNGSGFDPEQAAKPTSLGLLSMRERATAIGGTLEIASRPGTGTAVIFERPLGGDLVADATAAENAAGTDQPEPATSDALSEVRSA